MKGIVFNPLGKPIDGKGEISTSDNRLIEEMAPGIIKRRSVHEPMQTGITSIAVSYTHLTLPTICSV